MSLLPEDQRAVLLALARASSKKTSFSTRLVPQPVNAAVKKLVAIPLWFPTPAGAGTPTSPTAPKSPPAPVPINITGAVGGTGYHPAGWYFAITLDFALGPRLGYTAIGTTSAPVPTPTERTNWGLSFGNPLVNPVKNTVYMVRCHVSQLRVEPLIAAFILHWVRPVGWTWVDGQGTDIPVQVASNPLILSRLCLSPSSTIPKAGFTVDVKAFYPSG